MSDDLNNPNSNPAPPASNPAPPASNPAPPVSNPAPPIEPQAEPGVASDVQQSEPDEAVQEQPQSIQQTQPIQDPEDFEQFAEEDSVFKVEDIDAAKIKIKRGEEVNITQKDPAMKNVLVGLGWDMKAFESDPLDLDASIFLLNVQEQTRVDEDFVFYNNPQGGENSVRHMGDNRTGAGDGDDEQIMLDLTTMPLDVATIIFTLSIYDDDYKSPDFSMVKNVYFRVVNHDRDHELFRYELDEELIGNSGLIIARLERIGTEWIFRAVGETVEGGLGQIAKNYGIIVAEDVQS